LPFVRWLSIGDRYAARSLPFVRWLSIGDRYAARSLPFVRWLSIGDRYAARSLPSRLVSIERRPLRGPVVAARSVSIERRLLRGPVVAVRSGLSIGDRYAANFRAFPPTSSVRRLDLVVYTLRCFEHLQAD